jgi:DNA-binding SARP family transcriptional activator/ABC-type branched-subunit amino acid transport system substrate-binding protein/streptogramin lyase
VESTIEFRILGPLEVWREGGSLPLGGLKQRSLLALLLLQANQVVSTDRLVHELWGDEPPGTAVTALHGYISQLRKLIEPERTAGGESRVLVTRPPGYVLNVGPGQLDLDRFEASVRNAREELVAGRPEPAARDLREAFALWRGSPLADLASEPFAQSAARPLEELWLAALEDRIEADLALGRHREVASELEAVIRSHPLRERLRGQQMIALYRCGRQADALNAYADARRTLSEELGIEPSSALKQLERDILNQDASLGAPARETVPQAEAEAAPRRRRRTGVLFAGAAAAVVAVAAGSVLVTRSGSGGSTEVPPNAVARLAADGTLASSSAVGSHPTSVAVGAGAVWSLDSGDGTITRFDPRTHETRTFSPGLPLGDIAAGRDALWVIDQAGARVARIDGRSLAVNPAIALASRGASSAPPGGTAGGQVIAVGGGSVWALGGDLVLYRISESDGEVTRLDGVRHANTLTYGMGALWVVTTDNAVLRIDPRTGRVTRRIAVPADSLSGMAAGAGALWVTDPVDGLVWRIQLGPPRLVMRTIEAGIGAAAVTVGANAVWVVNGADTTVVRIDPVSGRATRHHLPRPPLAVAAAPGGDAWVSLADASPGGTSARAGKAAPVTASCSVTGAAGAAGADVVIVSDLPFQGRSRAQALAIDGAIRRVLSSRHHRAGRLTVGYQACDDSTKQLGGFEAETCAANARAYANDRRVVAVIGAYNSDCTQIEIPLANTARGGPLAMVSPASSSAGLTVRTEGQPPGTLGQLYPTGVRNFVRVQPNDNAQARADVVAARMLKIRRIAILLDPTSGPYGLNLATGFERAAKRAGIVIVRRGSWDPAADGYARLAASVVRDVDGVFLAGGMNGNSAHLLPALRKASSGRLRVVAPDGFISVPQLVDAVGPRAPWLLMSVAGQPATSLSRAARAFTTALAAKPPGGLPPDRYWPAYGAQAASTALSAIARSDGTREGVRKALFSTQLMTAFGPIAFDRNGDIEKPAFTLLRLAPAGAGMSDAGPDFADGTEAAAVVRP